MKRSYKTQQLQNYFDLNDIRVRQQQNTLDANILNAVALPLEEHELRLAREISGRSLINCPLNIDNLGVYYRAQIPGSFALYTDTNGAVLPPPNVTGMLNGNPVVLQPYNDLLPVPNALVLDPNRARAACSNPQLAAVTADGSYGPWTLPVPNRLSFFVNGIGDSGASISVLITGYKYPTLPWANALAAASESFTLTTEGLAQSLTAWLWVQSLQIMGLPDGAVLSVYSIAMKLPYAEDPRRPYQRWDDRDTLYNRYWYLDGATLNETYYQGSDYGFVDLSTGQFPPRIASYITPGAWADIAVEPNTYGMLGIGVSQGGTVVDIGGTQVSVTSQNSVVYYFDRREDMPGSLASSALTAEPRYGLHAMLDPLQKTMRAALLITQAYASAASTASYRFLVQFPNGSLFVYYNDAVTGWTLGQYKDYFWTPGAPPQQVTFPLQDTGTYVFTLETTDSATVLGDSCPFNHLQINASAVLASPVANMQGIGYDYKQQLWIWDGAALYPCSLVCQGYVFDPSTRTLYLTQNFDSVQIS